MAINIDRSKLKQAFPDPALRDYPEKQAIKDAAEGKTMSAEELAAWRIADADSRNYIVTSIIANATCERRVMDVITIKPILAAKPYNLDDWNIARIASGVGKDGEQYPSDVLSVVAHAVRRVLSDDKNLSDMEPKVLTDLSFIFARTLKDMRTREADLLKVIAPQAGEPDVVAEQERTSEEVVTAKRA